MRKNNKGMNRKALVNILILILLGLPACSPLDGLDQPVEVRATWTQVAHPTDQPYEVNTDDLSYIGRTPALILLGSQDPADESPILVQNISTDDVYDFSSIPPTSADTWSRPIVAENKDVFFQVGGMLYILSPGGQTRSVEIQYDEEDPTYCNWSWKSRLVCLNGTMTKGFFVDLNLIIEDMQLPSEAGNGAEVYYEPYRVGENKMRIVGTTTKTINGRETVLFKDLDLETMTVQLQQVRIEADFNRVFMGSDWNEHTREGGKFFGYGSTEYIQEGGNLGVMGISDDGEKIHLCSAVTYEENRISKSGFWMETYNTSTLELSHNEIQVHPEAEKKFYRNHMITSSWFDENTTTYDLLVIIDLESGKNLKEFLGDRYYYYATYNYSYSIFPYKEGWIFGFSYSLEYHRGNGDLMDTYYFMDYMIEFIGSDSYYTITQPMEP